MQQNTLSPEWVMSQIGYENVHIPLSLESFFEDLIINPKKCGENLNFFGELFVRHVGCAQYCITCPSLKELK